MRKGFGALIINMLNMFSTDNNMNEKEVTVQLSPFYKFFLGIFDIIYAYKLP